MKEMLVGFLLAEITIEDIQLLTYLSRASLLQLQKKDGNLSNLRLKYDEWCALSKFINKRLEEKQIIMPEILAIAQQFQRTK